MEDYTRPRSGFWMLVEELTMEPSEDNGEATEAKAHGDDDFYPDASI